MKTKHWDVEEDLSLDDDSVMRFNFNGGGKGHVCKSEHEHQNTQKLRVRQKF